MGVVAAAAVATAVVGGGCGGGGGHAANENPIVETLTLGLEGNEPNGLALQGSALYWASVAWDSDAAPHGSGYGYLQTVSTDGGGVRILGAGYLPDAVVADATNVYWTTLDVLDDAGSATPGGRIQRTPRAGGATTILFEGSLIAGSGDSNLSGLALAANHLYWAANTSGSGVTIMTMPVDGGTAVPLAVLPVGQNLDCIAASADAVYWATHEFSMNNVPSGSVMKQPLAGGPPVTLAKTSLPVAMAVGPSGVYWTDNGSVRSVALDGGPTVLLALDPDGVAGAIAIDATSVYWTTGNGIAKAPIGGGSPATLVSSGSGVGSDLVVDDTSVYWTTVVPCSSRPAACAAVQKVTPK
ncbi:MAG TPA: hypothetical protein VMI75_13675 [Polyangiaceae bacterium]|nr:hypothetical protein [Polyangiaceae bacterium]